MEAFHERLSSIMEEYKISQSELCARTGIPKSALSQYISGNFKPKQNRTYLLAKALNVSPAWLMGYDVPRTSFGEAGHMTRLTKREKQLIAAYRNNKEFHAKIDALIPAEDNQSDKSDQTMTEVFRAAKSLDGDIVPGHEKISNKHLKIIKDAPETDDDL